MGTAQVQPAIEGEIVAQRQACTTGRDRAASDGKQAGTECGVVVEVHHAATEGDRARARPRPLQVPGAAVDGELLEADVVGPADARRRPVVTGVVLQHQGVVGGTGADACINRARRCDLDPGYAGEQACRCATATGNHGGPCHGSESIAAGGITQMHTARDRARIGERIACRSAQADTTGDAATVGHVGLCSAIGHHRRRIRKLPYPQQRHSNRTIIDQRGGPTCGILRGDRLAAETQQSADVEDALDLAASLVVDRDRAATGGVVADHQAGRGQAETTGQERIDRAGVVDRGVAAAQRHRIAAQQQRHAEHRAIGDVQRQAAGRVDVVVDVGGAVAVDGRGASARCEGRTTGQRGSQCHHQLVRPQSRHPPCADRASAGILGDLRSNLHYAEGAIENQTVNAVHR